MPFECSGDDGCTGASSSADSISGEWLFMPLSSCFAGVDLYALKDAHAEGSRHAEDDSNLPLARRVIKILQLALASRQDRY